MGQDYHKPEAVPQINPPAVVQNSYPQDEQSVESPFSGTSPLDAASIDDGDSICNPE